MVLSELYLNNICTAECHLCGNTSSECLVVDTNERNRFIYEDSFDTPRNGNERYVCSKCVENIVMKLMQISGHFAPKQDKKPERKEKIVPVSYTESIELQYPYLCSLGYTHFQVARRFGISEDELTEKITAWKIYEAQIEEEERIERNRRA